MSRGGTGSSTVDGIKQSLGIGAGRVEIVEIEYGDTSMHPIGDSGLSIQHSTGQCASRYFVTCGPGFAIIFGYERRGSEGISEYPIRIYPDEGFGDPGDVNDDNYFAVMKGIMAGNPDPFFYEKLSWQHENGRWSFSLPDLDIRPYKQNFVPILGLAITSKEN